jgi:hypothetical protein
MAGKKKLTKDHIACLVREVLREEISKSSLDEAPPHTYGHKTRGQRIGQFLTKDLFAKKPDDATKEKRLEIEQRVRTLYSEIARLLGAVPKKLEDRIIALRDIKEKISQVLIWGDEPLLDLVQEDGNSQEIEE